MTDPTSSELADLREQVAELKQLLDDALSPDGLWIDGTQYTEDDLEFAEQRELREKVRELAPDGDVGEAVEMDVSPAVVWIVRRRTNPGYTIEEALRVKPRDLKKPADPQSGSETPVESGSPTT